MSEPHDLEELLTRFGPKPKESFAVLRPHGELIKGLRRSGASFETIRHVLEHKGVETCPTSIRRFCRKVLGEAGDPLARKRKSSRKSKAIPMTDARGSAVEPATAQSLKPEPAEPSRQTPLAPNVDTPAGAAPVLHSTPPTPVRERSTGPRIAKVEFIEEPKI